ncbi:MAG: hypothetical protein KatS3mg105_5184 [Gemmatales bacterium]|nr:MAG: hypothetical protein KatS3mg105_5184 [Gemmatales bacterium]
MLEIRAEKAALQFEASGFYLLDPQRPCFLHIGSEADAVLVADASGTACAVDLRGQVIRRFPTEDDLVAATAAEDGRQMAVLDSAGNVELFNVQTNQQANWRIDDLGSNCQLQFSGNGRFLLVQRSSPSVVWVIDTTAPDAETRSWRGSTGLLSHDGSRIYLRTDLANSVRVEVRTVSGNQRLGVWEADGQVAGWSLVDRERLLAVAHRDQVLLLDADDLSHRGTCAGHADRILSVVADRRSDRMATRDRLGKVMLWSSHSDRERRSIQLNWSPSGPLLCDMAEDDPSIALAAHAIGTVTSLYSPRVPERESLNLDGTMVGLMPDGRLLLWEQDRLRLWNASGTRILDEVDIEPIQHALTAVHVVPEGDLAFIVNRKSGATYLYRTGRLVQRLDDPDAGSVAHSIAEVAPRIAMRYRDGRLVVRDVVTMQEFALGTIDTRWRSFKLAPDGKRIYLRDGHEIECRDVESGEVVFTREIPADDIRLMIPVNTDRMVIVSTGRNDSNLSAELWELSESPRKIVSTLVNRMQGWELTPDLRYVCFGTHDGLAVIDVGGGTVSRRQPGRLTLARPFSTDLFYLSLEGPQTGSDPREAVTSETSQTSDRNGDPSLRRAELYRWSPDGEDQRLAEIRVRPRMTRFAYNGRVVAASFEEAKFIELTFNNARYDRPIRLEVSRLNTRGISKPKANARLLPSRAAARCTSTIIADVWNAN